MKKFKKHNLKQIRERSFFKVNDYWMTIYWDHPYHPKNGYMYYHRLVMENKLNRYLSKDEIVHHDDNPENNRGSNLKLTSHSRHAIHHARARGNVGTVPKPCESCGEKFRPRRSAQKCCSRRCSQRSSRKVTHPPKKKLKRLVWKYPRTELAKRLGVSDSAIGHWCRRLGIAMPPRGYWAKKRAGKL